MNVLVVVAHPDDETLGMGGTIRKHADRDDNVLVASFCATRASDSFRAACELLGATAEPRGYPDQELDLVPIPELVCSLAGYSPGIIYTHNPTDLNADHRRCTEAVLVAFRPHRFKGTILAFETISSTEWGVEPFAANWFEELNFEQENAKMAALDCYANELRTTPHPRNATGINALARVRGGQCGIEFAEAFRLLRRGPG